MRIPSPVVACLLGGISAVAATPAAPGLLAVEGAGPIVPFETGAIRKRVPAVQESPFPTWFTYEQPWTLGLAGVAWGNGTFVLAGSDDFWPSDLMPYVYTSSDGMSWMRRWVPVVGTAFPPRFVNGRFFLAVRAGVGDYSSRTEAAGSTTILTSVDGVYWISSGFIAGGASSVNAPADYAFGNGLYVAVGSSFFSGTAIVTSSDGVRWTPRIVNGIRTDISAQNVVFFKGRFYVTLYTLGGSNSSLYSSADGEEWTRVTTAPGNPRYLAVNATVLLLTAFDGSTSRLTLSTDGETFISAPTEAGEFSQPIRYRDGVFVTAEPNSERETTRSPITLRASYDGLTWSTVGQVTRNDSSVRDFERGNGHYVILTNLLAFTGASDIAPGGAPAVAPASTRLNNISIRAHAGTGAETLAVGVTFGDTGAGGSKHLLLRGVGPTLAQFGIAGTLADPRVDWMRGTSVLASNNDWNGNREVELAAGAVGAFALPAISKDSALVVSDVRPGGYTLRLPSAAGDRGVALAEIYDLTPSANAKASDPRLTSFSARTQVGSGGEALIAGFVVTGERTRLLVRAVGPSLQQFGVAGFLPDPQVSLFRGSVLVATNDNWDASRTPNSLPTGSATFPLAAGSRDAALLVELEAGSYTVAVQGADEIAGQALLEIFEAPAPSVASAGTLAVQEFTIRFEWSRGNFHYYPHLRLVETSGMGAVTVRSLTFSMLASGMLVPFPVDRWSTRIAAGGESTPYAMRTGTEMDFYLTDPREATGIFVEVAYTDANGRESTSTAAAQKTYPIITPRSGTVN